MDVLARSAALQAAWILGASCSKKALSAQMQATLVASQLVDPTAARAGWSYGKKSQRYVRSRPAGSRLTAQGGSEVS